jgi:2-oxoglutarate ferredoxin oxidoreductase subunit alpha
MEKRMRKLDGLKSEISPPGVYGSKDADITLIGWGSTYNVICEAVGILREGGANVNAIHLTELWPFPAEAVAGAMGNDRNTFVIENNITSQLSHLIQAETGRKPKHKILKYDGRPFTPAYLVREVRKGVL